MLDIKKGNNSANNVSGVTCFNLCKMAGHALHCTKFPEIIANGIKINLSTSSGHALYFYQVLLNYLDPYQSYRVDTISILKITKGNNSAKNVGGINAVNLCTSSGHALYFYQVL